MLSELKLRLGNSSWGFTDTQLYSYLNNAKKKAEERIPLSFRSSVSCKTTAGTGSINLNATYLDLTSNHSCLGVFENGVRWDNNDPMDHESVRWIDQWREENGSSSSGEPQKYALHRVGDVLKIELAPAPEETIGSFNTAKLKLDIIERTTDIDTDTDCVLPEYCHDYIVMLTAFRVACDIPGLYDHRFVFRTKDRFRPGILDVEEKQIINRANSESSGSVNLGRAIIR